MPLDALAIDDEGRSDEDGRCAQSWSLALLSITQRPWSSHAPRLRAAGLLASGLLAPGPLLPSVFSGACGPTIILPACPACLHFLHFLVGFVTPAKNLQILEAQVPRRARPVIQSTNNQQPTPPKPPDDASLPPSRPSLGALSSPPVFRNP